MIEFSVTRFFFPLTIYLFVYYYSHQFCEPDPWKNMDLDPNQTGRRKERKGGRKEGRKEGRKVGRKEGRSKFWWSYTLTSEGTGRISGNSNIMWRAEYPVLYMCIYESPDIEFTTRPTIPDIRQIWNPVLPYITVEEWYLWELVQVISAIISRLSVSGKELWSLL